MGLLKPLLNLPNLKIKMKTPKLGALLGDVLKSTKSNIFCFILYLNHFCFLGKLHERQGFFVCLNLLTHFGLMQLTLSKIIITYRITRRK